MTRDEVIRQDAIRSVEEQWASGEGPSTTADLLAALAREAVVLEQEAARQAAGEVADSPSSEAALQQVNQPVAELSGRVTALPSSESSPASAEAPSASPADQDDPAAPPRSVP